MKHPTKRSRLALLLFPLSLAFCVLLSHDAYAQIVVPPAAPVVTAATISAATIVIALLGIVVGYLAQAIQSGSLFGVVTIPKTWIPYLGLAGGFLGPLTASITASPLKDESAWVTALFAGLVGLGGVVSGITAKQHIDAAKRDRTPLIPPSISGTKIDAVNQAANDVSSGTLPPAAKRAYRAPQPISARLAWPRWITRTVLATAVLGVSMTATTAMVETGCSNPPTPQTQAVINAAATLALCVETVIQQDESATPPASAPQVIVDEGTTCAGEALALVNAIGQEMTPAPTSAGLIANVHADVMARRAAAKSKGH
jgi:hypothetical protein